MMEGRRSQVNKSKTIFLTILAFTITAIVVILSQTSNVYYGAQNVYRVYLNGESLGIIESKEEMDKYINDKQDQIKQQYNVKNVYAPQGLEIKKEVTYNKKLSTTEEIYNKIENKEPFTIEGYVVTIKTSGTDNRIRGDEAEISEEEANKRKTTEINILHKNIIKEAIDQTVLSFVDEQKYNDYLANLKINQEEIGYSIENVYLDENVTIRKDFLPTNEVIFQTTKELAKYLLFGTMEKEKTYTVKSGDTIQKIASANTLSVNELLIANPDIAGEKALLYEGQKVVVSLIDPLLTIVEETHNVATETVKRKTITQEDSSLYTGFTKVVQQGEDGQNLVTKKIRKENGHITKAIIAKNEVIKPAVNRIVKTGNKTEFAVATGTWNWPTKTPYIITSPMGARWGRMHEGLDISGTGHGSPIYAAGAGTVIRAGWFGAYGKCIDVDHHNGLITRYGHLATIYVRTGQAVSQGQVIGGMGSTGRSTGTHLHFEVRRRGVAINPYSLYR